MRAPKRHAAHLPDLLYRGRCLLPILPLLILVVAGCGQSTASPSAKVVTIVVMATPATSPGRVLVTFAADADYDAVLQSVTDLGLEPIWPCNGAKAGNEAWARWQPSGMHDQWPTTHFLWLAPTPLAAPDWLARLRDDRDISNIDTSGQIWCPVFLESTPPPGTLVFLHPDQTGAVARVSFTSPANTYAAALDALSNLGLRLADPCIERASATPPPTPRAWQAVGQETGFAASGSLVVATTVNASNDWQDQMRAVAGVRAIAVPYAPAC